METEVENSKTCTKTLKFISIVSLSVITAGVLVLVVILATKSNGSESNNSEKFGISPDCHKSICSNVETNKLWEIYEKDLDFILSGVSKITMWPLSGLLTVFGNNTFPILTARSNEGTYHPVVAAGYFRKGRFAVYSLEKHHFNFQITDNDRLLSQIIQWVTKGKINATVCTLLANWKTHSNHIISYMKRSGKVNISLENRNQSINRNQLKNLTYLRQHDFMHINSAFDLNLNEQELETIKEYSLGGGGIIIGSTADFTRTPLSCFQQTYVGNKILNFLGGVAFEGYQDYQLTRINTYGSKIIDANRSTLQDTHAEKVWSHVKHRPNYVNLKNQQQIKTTLQHRIKHSPLDVQFFKEIINKVVLLLTRRENLPVNEFVSQHRSDIWGDMKTALKRKQFINMDTLIAMKHHLARKAELELPCFETTLWSEMISEIIDALAKQSNGDSFGNQVNQTRLKKETDDEDLLLGNRDDGSGSEVQINMAYS